MTWKSAESSSHTVVASDYFEKVIEQQFPKVALLLSVLSPRYIESKWCIRELKAFCRAAEQTGGILVGKNRDKSRIFKVIKTEVDKDEHPDEIRDFLGYPFYGVTSKGERIEFNNIYGSEAEEEYHKALLQLAYDIKDLLKELLADTKQEKSAASPDNSGISIYLAETTSDIAEAREKVKSELQSEMCMADVEHATMHNKRILPVVVREGFDPQQVHPELAKIQWLYCRESDDFDHAFRTMIQVLDTDLDYVRAHTWLLVRTIEWEHLHRNEDLLLRGVDLIAAERLVSQSKYEAKEPRLTNSQSDYVNSSRALSERLIQQEQKRHQLELRAGISIFAVRSLFITLVLLSLLGLFGFQQYRLAQHYRTELENLRQFPPPSPLPEP